MKNRVEVLPSELVPLADLRNFLNEYFSCHIYSDENFFTWQHGIGIANGCENASYVSVDQQQGINGFLSAWTLRYRADGCDDLEVTQSSNIVSLGNSLAYPALMGKLHQHPVIFAANMSPKVIPSQYAYGYQHSHLVRLFCFFAIPKFLRKLPRLALYRPKNSELLPEASIESTGDVNEFLTINLNLNSIDKKYRYSQASFLWRYCQHPYFNYKYLLFRTKVGRLIIIYRLQKSIENDTLMRIATISGDLNSLKFIMNPFREFCIDNRVAFVDISSNSYTLQDQLTAAGWISDIIHRSIKIPLKFAPPTETPFATHPIAFRTTVGHLYYRSFNITASDIDCDRPTTFGLLNQLYI